MISPPYVEGMPRSSKERVCKRRLQYNCKMPHLHLIRTALMPAAETKRRIRKAAKPAEVIQCHKCGGREVIETRTGVVLKDGKPSGGTKSLLCASCWNVGDRVVLA